VLYNFVVADDPGYSAEPMLRSDNVTAYIRITSLWRGRMEIGTLDLDAPSLNLVRRADGHWNAEELLERASQSSPAPTGDVRATSRPRFPYVEASAGRINLKLGEAKKPFAFTDADFALWVDSESSWGVRMVARPVRTDVNISDTGTVKLDGQFQRAANLRDTLVSLRVNYSNGPLGQLTKLVYGRDRGWRGTVGASAALAGWASPSTRKWTTSAATTSTRARHCACARTARAPIRQTAMRSTT
jgi:AsmA protein